MVTENRQKGFKHPEILKRILELLTKTTLNPILDTIDKFSARSNSFNISYFMIQRYNGFYRFY